VAIIEVRQHWQYSGAVRQAVAATATQLVKEEKQEVEVETESLPATLLCSAVTAYSSRNE